ncbi:MULTISPECIES: SDR family NAD(P)-dependent oxidoreductase [unclassified Roseitalea]|uniref:SDR family NAD(P)-dependent oxidoreductase n=1 Tax=unclassified Roseitalea TaxID=2639107 RepID=UPI00273E9F8C|nr:MULTISPECIES: SDR family NAD(P)-dependent oxidoreductase [unclassified Roseitalea]
MSALYRIRPSDGVVWITGASAGIGRALALGLAAKGYDVVATARGADKLDALAAGSADLLGRIHALPCDVTDRAAMAEAVATIEDRHGRIAGAVFNAGNFWPVPGEALDVDAFEKTYRLNLFGLIYGLVPVVERMKAHGRGHVVLVGSSSGYAGLPSASAYGASKAAINNMAEALKFDFDKLNIRIQIVNPGFIDTPQTRKNEFEMPALMPVEKAAGAFIAGMENGGFEITFPRRFTYLLKLMRMMPHPVYFWIMRRATGWNRRAMEFGDTTPASVIRQG